MTETTLAEQVVNAKSRATDFVKNKMFDLIAVAIAISMLALSLGVLELREINLREIANIVLETLPFYLSTILLNNNYYMKGTYAGKATKSFKAIVTAYSNRVNHLSGMQIKLLPEFCDAYNSEALIKLQSAILRREALTIDQFNVDYVDADGSHGPLKALSKHELIHLIGEERAKVVKAAKAVKVKGISSNILLGNSTDIDTTNLGPNERETANRRRLKQSVTSFLSIFVLMLIVVRDTSSWGWVGIVLVVFKLLYILARSYMRYFEGYQDITVSLANHISRKTDIIKQFESECPNLENSSVVNNCLEDSNNQ